MTDLQVQDYEIWYVAQCEAAAAEALADWLEEHPGADATDYESASEARESYEREEDAGF